MDPAVESIAEYVDSLKFDALDEHTLQSIRARFVDSIGCMIGGLPSEPGAVARDYAMRGHASEASLMGGGQTSVEDAAFANTVMQRYLDFNDSNPGGGHFSDLIPGLVAVAEAHRRSGKDLSVAIVAAYEVAARLAAVTRIRIRGWDNATYLNVASGVAAAKLMGLSRLQLRETIAMSSISNISTWASREGEVSMWKACAAASSCRHGIFTAELSRRGMTGPSAPISGRFGLADQVADTSLLVEFDKESRAINSSAIKQFPCQDDAQGPIEIALALGRQIEPSEISSIEVDSFHITYSPDGTRVHPHKWDPQTRESADHSLPYLIAVALADHRVDLDSFLPERFLDPELRPLMEKVTIRQRPDFRERYPTEMPCTVTIMHRDGSRLEGTIVHPHGHPNDPMTTDEINAKFDYLASRSTKDLDPCIALRELCWKVDSINDVAEIGGLFAEITPSLSAEI